MVSVEYAVILLEILELEVNIEIHSSDLHTLVVVVVERISYLMKPF